MFGKKEQFGNLNANKTGKLLMQVIYIASNNQKTGVNVVALVNKF